MPLKIAIVGLGYMGMIHLQKALTLKDVEVVALIEKDRKKLEELREKFKIRCYEDYREIDSDINGVIISTPATTHYEIARFYLDMGIHVFVEKPLALSFKEAKELSDISEKKGLKLLVGFPERYNPAFREGLKFIERPIFFEARRTSTYEERTADVDVVHDLMIHDLDLLSTIEKGEPESIFAEGISLMGENLDEAFAFVRFSQGTRGVFFASRISTEKERSLRIVDKNGIVKIDFLNTKLTLALRRKRGFEIVTYGYDKRDVVKEELLDFVLSIRGEKDPPIRAKETLLADFFAERIVGSIVSRLG